MSNNKWLYLQDVVFRLPENFCGTEREAVALFLEYMSQTLSVKDDERLEFEETNVKLSDLDETLQDAIEIGIDSLPEDYNATFGYCIFEDDREIEGE